MRRHSGEAFWEGFELGMYSVRALGVEAFWEGFGLFCEGIGRAGM